MELDAGMHVEFAGEPIDLSDDRDLDHTEPDGATLLDEVAEVFNARDLDQLLDLCAPDCEVPGLASDLDELGPAIADLWERRPTVRLTRDEHEGRAVGIVWEYEGSWAALGTVHLVVDGEAVTLLEFSDDATLLDELDGLPPDEDDLGEGATWEEWHENPDQ